MRLLNIQSRVRAMALELKESRVVSTRIDSSDPVRTKAIVEIDFRAAEDDSYESYVIVIRRKDKE